MLSADVQTVHTTIPIEKIGIVCLGSTEIGTIRYAAMTRQYLNHRIDMFDKLLSEL
jgi:hypothetical protein